MIIAMERVVLGFAMPGTGIADYNAHTAAIAKEGIYSVSVFHDQVLAPTLRFWHIEDLTGLSSEASLARDKILRHAQRVCRIGQRFEQQRLEQLAASVRAQQPGGA
jgi:acyl-[acyl-carrier-protein] desaturase